MAFVVESTLQQSRLNENDLWRELEPSMAVIKHLVRLADREAMDRGATSDASSGRLLGAFGDLVAVLDETVGDAAPASAAAKKVAGARVQSELLPYLLLSDNGDRWYSKPRGYAGDYLSIARMYENEPRGHGRIGALLDRCFLELPAARAVQNRRSLLAREIQTTIDARQGECARVTSLACGPAQELFDVYESLKHPGVLRSTLVDFDAEALAHVAARRDTEERFAVPMDLVNENLIHLATGRRRIALVDQDLIYSIGLIDYFPDALVVKLLNFAHAALRGGGRVIVGNFHPRNPTKALMDYVLDWKLVHRTEHQMHRLFEASAFRRSCTRIVYEEQGINLFAECIKS